MLRAAGVDGYPVLVARQGSFAAIPDLPSPAPFNHVVIAIPAGGRYSFLDPSTMALPTGRVPGALQGQRGLLISPTGTELVDLPVDPPEANVSSLEYDLALAADGTISGSVRAQLDGLDAAYARGLQARGASADEMKALLASADAKLVWQEVLAVGGAKAQDPDATLKLQIVIGPTVVAAPDERTGALPIFVDDLVGRALPYVWREVRYAPLVIDHKGTQKIKVSIDLPDGIGVEALPGERGEDGSLVKIAERTAVANGELFIERSVIVDARDVLPVEVRCFGVRVTGFWNARAINLVNGGYRGLG
jgi:hypothetical protein